MVVIQQNEQVYLNLNSEKGMHPIILSPVWAL